MRLFVRESTHLKFDDAWSGESWEYLFLDGVNEVERKDETLIPILHVQSLMTLEVVKVENKWCWNKVRNTDPDITYWKFDDTWSGLKWWMIFFKYLEMISSTEFQRLIGVEWFQYQCHRTPADWWTNIATLLRDYFTDTLPSMLMTLHKISDRFSFFFYILEETKISKIKESINRWYNGRRGTFLCRST